FFTNLRVESQIISKIAVKSTPRNSPNLKLCHELTIQIGAKSQKMWGLSQNSAVFCARSLTLASHPVDLPLRDEFCLAYRWQTV
ncbi:hypothetical protein, partial [Escherichia coli]